MNAALPMPAPDRERKPAADGAHSSEAVTSAQVIREIDGPSGPEPTRYGDWERKGRCIDF